MGNILGALYLAVLFLGIINSRTVQPPAAYERSVRSGCHPLSSFHSFTQAPAPCHDAALVSPGGGSALVWGVGFMKQHMSLSICWRGHKLAVCQSAATCLCLANAEPAKLT